MTGRNAYLRWFKIDQGFSVWLIRSNERVTQDVSLECDLSHSRRRNSRLWRPAAGICVIDEGVQRQIRSRAEGGHTARNEMERFPQGGMWRQCGHLLEHKPVERYAPEKSIVGQCQKCRVPGRRLAQIFERIRWEGAPAYLSRSIQHQQGQRCQWRPELDPKRRRLLQPMQ